MTGRPLSGDLPRVKRQAPLITKAQAARIERAERDRRELERLMRRPGRD